MASGVGTRIADLDTPALVVDIEAMERNIARISSCLRDAGKAWRPHTKGIKVPAIAHRMIRSGAIGITCAKVSEAEVMVAAGIDNILIANQIVGATKLQRLAALRRSANVMVARRTYDAMSDPRLVVAVGACAVSGAPYPAGYASGDGAASALPVDVFVPGCPPRPQAIIDGLLLAMGRLEARATR